MHKLGLTTEQLVCIFKTLTGHVDWWCESNYDRESEENLPLFGDALCELVCDLLDYYKGAMTRYEYSAKYLAKKYGEWLDVIADYMQEYKDYKNDFESETKSDE